MQKLTPTSFKAVLDKHSRDLTGKVQRSVQYQIKILKELRKVYPIKGHHLSLFYNSSVNLGTFTA